ncbi:MAG TPA: DoxX family protein [Devosiaceae bacterium]|jgi:putative oxidoreductase
MPTDLPTTLIFIGRVLLGAAFFIFGLRNAMGLDRLTAAMTARGLPMPRVCMVIGVAMQILGGASVALNVLPILGAIDMIVFLLVAVFLFHNFWDYPQAERRQHVNAWIMNIGLSGAFLMVIAHSL